MKETPESGQKIHCISLGNYMLCKSWTVAFNYSNPPPQSTKKTRRPRTASRIIQTDSLACGRATAVATVHWTVAKSRLSNPSSPTKPKNPVRTDWVLVWWGRTDSNHRSDTQQIYSLSPLATRELPHIHFCLIGAGRRTREIKERLVKYSPATLIRVAFDYSSPTKSYSEWSR